MAAHDVHAIIIQPMMRIFGEFGTDDADFIVKTYVRQFEKFDRKVLTEAWEDVLADFMPSKRQPWPPIALIRKAAERKAEEAAAANERVSGVRYEKIYPEWSKDAIAAADALIRSELGREAASEGWITQLHDYCRTARALPDATNIAKLKREARLFDEAYAKVSRGEVKKETRDALLELGDTFLRKRDELAAIAAGAE